ncbi:P-loop containing nucleoside triphosphate hydrolase protein, partial [Catenaria anguillulae PL171]
DPRSVYSDERIWSILESSSTLSLGQRQLVCMARALLRDTRIYVLDEASASIDLPTEAALQACLRSELMVGRTLIVIAHRIHTVLALDRILVLDKGSVIEDGAPLDLVRQDGSHFRSLVEDAGLLDAALKGEL